MTKKPAGEDTTLDASEHPLRHAPAPPANAHAELLVDQRSAALVPSHPLPEVDPQVYKIEGEHARGGLGRILRAWDRRLDRPVAIKQLLRMHPHSEARFVREALLTARLQHPSIVPVMEAGRWPSGEPFYSMKLVTGQPLSAAIGETHSLDDRLALLPRVLAAAEAIGYAHSQHIIHRDLKPANILLGPFGETLVIDWGLAKELGSEAGDPLRGEAPGRVETAAVTVEGSIVGTPAFMPPEQARGDEVDERADVYALGAVLYAVFAAKPPYRGSSSQEILRSVVAGPPRSIEVLVPGLPFELATIIRTAMARDPAARYPTARELSADLRRFETGQLVSAQAYSPLVRFRRWLRRHRATVTVASILGAALLITGIAGLAGIIAERNRSERARAVAQARSNQLILSQARNVLDRDPTAALAWIKTYPLDGADREVAFDLAVQAASRPIALHVLAGHTTSDLTGAFFAGGSRFISGGADKTLRLWDLTTGRQIASSAQAGTIRVIRSSPDGQVVFSGDNSGRIAVSDVGLARSRILVGHAGPIIDIAALPDGRRMVSTGDDGTIRVWDVDQGSARVLRGHKGSVYAIALSPDGTSLASAGWDHTVRLWDLASGRDRLLGAHTSEVSSVVFSPDGVHVASAGLDGVICLWSGGGGCRALEGHDGVVQALAFSPDGQWIASAGRDKTVRLWGVSDGARRVLRGHTDEVVSIAFAPDGRSLVSGSVDGTVRIWSLDSDQSTRLVGHRAGIKIDRVVVSPDGKRIVSLADDGELRVWPNLATGRVLHGHRDLVFDVAFSPDQRLVATSSRDKTIRVWDLASGNSRALAGHTDLVLRARFSPDGKRIVSTSLDNTVRAWDVVTGHQEVLATQAAYDIRFLSDGRFVARGNNELITIFDLHGGSQRTLRGHASQVMAMAVAPNGRSLVSGDQQGLIRVWDLDTGEGRQLASQPEGVTDLAFSLDGSLIASAGNDKRVRLWNAATGECRTWGPLSAAPQTVVFSSDGQWVAADSNQTIRVWNLRTGESRDLAGHSASIKRIAFAAGNLLVSAGRDHTVRLWDPATGAQAIVHDHGSQVRSLTLSRDGTLVATGSADTTSWIGSVDAARLLSPEPVKLQEGIAAMSSAATGLNDQVGTPQ